MDFKELAGRFSMDSILQTAFGSKDDSLYDADNEIMQKAKANFSSDLDFRSMLFFSLLFTCPKLLPFITKVVNLDKGSELADFFKSLSLKLIEKKRKQLELERQQVDNNRKATNFLEMLLDAEQEFKKKEGVESKTGKTTKCEFKNIHFLRLTYQLFNLMKQF